MSNFEELDRALEKIKKARDTDDLRFLANFNVLYLYNFKYPEALF